MKAFNDKNMMTDILYHLKDLMTTMGTAVKESNCENMRAMLTTLSGKVATEQFKVFQYLNKNGMYPIENAPIAQLNQIITMHSKK